MVTISSNCFYNTVLHAHPLPTRQLILLDGVDEHEYIDVFSSGNLEEDVSHQL